MNDNPEAQERAAFEAWAVEQGVDATRGYDSGRTADYWTGWQARAALAQQAATPTGDTLSRRLQQQCSDWGTYWRAPDAHGVNLTTEQATELLRDALGVEVEIAAASQAATPAPAEPVATITEIEHDYPWRVNVRFDVAVLAREKRGVVAGAKLYAAPPATPAAQPADERDVTGGEQR